jgi:DNA-binding MarR family transcriptional regulator
MLSIALPLEIYRTTIYIGLSMRLITEDYQALAEFRYQIRRFLVVSEGIAHSGKLQPQQYMMLLALRGLPAEKEPTLLVLSERLQIRHNSAVELANRLARQGLIRRYRSKGDSRKVFLRLTTKGAGIIEKLVKNRYIELHSSQPELARALNQIIARTNKRNSKRQALPGKAIPA